MSTFGDDGSTLSVVIIDGQDVVHAGIGAWLTGAVPPIKVVGNYAAPADFMKSHPSATPDVDVVLFALQYEGRSPDFDALRTLCRAGHRVIVYSSLVSDEVILTSLDAGAVTYVAKSERANHLCEAIYSARSDTPYIPPRTAKALLNDKTKGRPNLTQRERDILIAWFRTESKEAVAKQFFIEPSTVASHLQRIRAKYAAIGRPAPTKGALIARAIQDGALAAEDI
ncbi:response regulator containing a CheY-like receiver domain and an HTH DNA-binding domain [Mycobacterium sp. JS623]|uniref:DNA-binding response regulator n=1 Tax=Mycobacterium sp. JS623 TaxID=212767 RepID=UPI0002A57268|nr:LuxR C-terminal-related transcriptional regulator [Mycobacterium sp. JS623]AGB24289.1 response regulator containing a CheY-like receiver domain and an HTH DNA-binding domain [Mycobacterium sp. JS623]